ncbi:type VI secretion system baseplate subunit TssE [Escherichia fergusonii]|uniref:type VI secretion system baseplate subunit TssE n=1 Tax=Escherichia fergusonii TaxID=564 RepID=UPI000F667AB7|nr:type VI secretion system baseplate subunit TssE [Escherichia fergusonii]QCZ31933.1 type VI secretion system baseplate subunit TssE [Escherichia fergusonii]
MKYQDRGLRASGSLFERVREAARSPVSRPVNAGMLQLSIRHNLHNILNTRPGSCRASPLLGILDFNDAATTSQGFNAAIERAVKECIEKHEPRITHADVYMEKSDTGNGPLDLRLHITATVEFQNVRDVLEFSLSLDNKQHYLVD